MSIDIVELIESNPITKLTGNYQSKLIEKVQNSFTNYEQQIFLSSFYCYLKYDNKKDFVIDLDNVWKWLDFSQKYNAKCVLEKNFNINKDYKVFAPASSGAKKDTRGGHNKEIIMLNIDTFKKFCLKAGTKKADEVHDYFIKLENIMFEMAKEESEELRQQLMQLENSKNKEMEIKLSKQKDLEKEKILLDKFAASGPLVYIIKIKSFSNGEYIIKIGESRKGILNRYKEHKSKYEECLLLNCFSVDKSKEFESFLHHNLTIRQNIVTNLEGHEKETELFLIGKSLTYQMLVKIINDNIDTYNYKVSELLSENELLKTKLNIVTNNNQNNNNIDLTQLTNLINNLVTEIAELKKSNQIILNKLNEKEPKLVTGFNQQNPHLGPRLQQINPETMQLVKVYESVTEAMNDNKNIKRPSIMKAIEENTIYCGFRWQTVERNLDANIIHDIQPTKETKVQSLGYIAKLNKDKTEILNVYLDRKTAAKLNGYTSSSALDNPVKNNTLANGYYYMLYDNCDYEIIHNFQEKINRPLLLYKNGLGKYDLDKKLIQDFSSKYDCIRTCKISDKTLNKAIETKMPYNGYYYFPLGSKISIF